MRLRPSFALYLLTIAVTFHLASTEPAPDPFDGPGVGQVQFLSPTLGYVWVGTGRGSIRMTRDGGATWSPLFPPRTER